MQTETHHHLGFCRKDVSEVTKSDLVTELEDRSERLTQTAVLTTRVECLRRNEKKIRRIHHVRVPSSKRRIPGVIC